MHACAIRPDAAVVVGTIAFLGEGFDLVEIEACGWGFDVVDGDAGLRLNRSLLRSAGGLGEGFVDAFLLGSVEEVDELGFLW